MNTITFIDFAPYNVFQLESPFDGRKNVETKTSRPKPQRTYEYTSTFSERDPEFEAKVRFYRQYWRQKAKRQTSAYQGSRPYDFDSWFDAHYGSSFESKWHGNFNEKDSDSEEKYGDSQRTKTWKFDEKKTVRPPRETTSNTSPFDFEHIYTHPIEYTIRRQQSEKTDEVVIIVAIISLLFGVMVSVTFLVERANLDRNKLNKNDKLSSDNAKDDSKS